jgi:WD40 repeat protein
MPSKHPLCQEKKQIVTILSHSLTSNSLAVVSEENIFLYDQKNELLRTFKTCANPLGLVSFVYDKNTEKCTLAFPGEKKGHIQLVNITNDFSTMSFKAHEGALRVLTLNKKGTTVASASENGTLVRLFSTDDGKQLHEFRSNFFYIFKIIV